MKLIFLFQDRKFNEVPRSHVLNIHQSSLTQAMPWNMLIGNAQMRLELVGFRTTVSTSTIWITFTYQKYTKVPLPQGIQWNMQGVWRLVNAATELRMDAGYGVFRTLAELFLITILPFAAILVRYLLEEGPERWPELL